MRRWLTEVCVMVALLVLSLQLDGIAKSLERIENYISVRAVFE